MQGYLNVKENFLSNGWFFTGDAGYINKRGHLVVIDRMSIYHIPHKIKVFSQYIENKLKFSSYIAEARLLDQVESIYQ